MEWGEQAAETAARELTEETGLSAEIGLLMGVQSEWFDKTTSDIARGARADPRRVGPTPITTATKRGPKFESWAACAKGFFMWGNGNRRQAPRASR